LVSVRRGGRGGGGAADQWTIRSRTRPTRNKHVGENYSGAALDGHDARRRFASMPLYGQSSGSPRGFNALSCFNVRLDWPAPGVIYTPCFCIPSEATRTINLRSSRSKRLAAVRNSYANPSKAALVSSSLVL